MSANGNGNNGLVKYGANSNNFAVYVKERQAALAQAVASHVDPKKLYRTVITCVSQTPALQQCTVVSIFRAMIQAGELGLDPTSALGECYLVPYKDQCQMIVGYRGLINLARRSGEVEKIQAACVYEGDEFLVEQGFEENIRHIPKFSTRDPQKILYFYAIATLKGGIKQFDVMTREDVDKIRARSASARSTSSPWQSDYAEMGRKTVVRRLAKYLPMSVEMARAVEIDTSDEMDDLDTPIVNVAPVNREEQNIDPLEDDITQGGALPGMDVPASAGVPAQAAGA